MVKMNLSNSQMAFEYALYMIAGSYFNKAVCLSKLQERNMALAYREEKQKSQIFCEDICISFMEELKQQLADDFFDRNVEVKFIKRAGGAITEIIFRDNEVALSFHALFKGSKSVIYHKVWTKDMAA